MQSIYQVKDEGLLLLRAPMVLNKGQLTCHHRNPRVLGVWTARQRLSLFALSGLLVFTTSPMNVLKKWLQKYRKHIGFEDFTQFKNQAREDTSRLVMWVIFIGGLWLLWLGIAFVIMPVLAWFIEGVPFEVSLDNLFQ